MIKLLSLTLAALALVSVSALDLADLPQTDGIGELSDANFKEFIESNKYVLVLFYSLDCAHSRRAIEYYSKVAEKLAAENLKMPVTRIDVDRNHGMAGEYGIKGVPMLKLFVKTYPISYQSSNVTPNQVFEWVETVLANKYSDELKSLEDVREIEELSIAGILYLPRGDVDQLEDFNHVAGSHENIPFYYTHNEKHARHLNLTSKYGFVIVRNFDDGPKIFGGDAPISMSIMAEFLKMFGTPLVEDLSQDLLNRYYDNMGIAMLYFGAGRDHPEYEEFKSLCFKRHLSMGCIFGDKDLHDTAKFLEDLGVDAEEPRTAFIVHFKYPKAEFYKFAGEFRTDDLDNFVIAFFQKSAPRYYKSQKEVVVEKERRDYVPHITGREFDEKVIHANHTVILQVQSQNCSSCGQWKPILQDMLISFAAQGGFMVYQIDGTKNDHEHLHYEAIPAVLLYMKKDKTKPLEYKGNKNLPEFKDWISKMIKIKLKDLKELGEDKNRREEAERLGQKVEEDTFEDEPQEELVIDAAEEETRPADVFDEGTDL